MALDQFENFVRDSLSSSVTSSATTFPVNNASTFPDPANGEYNLVVWDVANHPRPDQDPDVEVVRVTGRDTTNDELTVTRGQEGTSGASHPSGAALHLSYTQKLAADVEADYVAEGENFDGQGTSQFTNLASVGTEESRTTSRTITINIPTDFPDVSSALDEIRERRASTGLRFTVNIESGHEWQGQVTLNRDDMRHVKITSEDATVPLSSNIGSSNPILFIDNHSVSPIIDVQIDASGITHGNGFVAFRSSFLRLSTNAGVTDATNQAIRIVASGIHADAPVVDGAGVRGISMGNGSFGQASSISAQNCDRGVRCSMSVIDLQGGTFDGSTIGVLANNGGIVNVNQSSIDNCSDMGILSRDGSTVYAEDATANNCENYGILATKTGKIQFRNGNITGGNGEGAVALQGGLINCDTSTIENVSDNCINAESAGKVSAESVTLKDPGLNGISTRDGATVSAKLLTATGAGFKGINGRGSQIIVRGGSVTGSSSDDISINEGAFVTADECETSSSTGGDPHVNDVNKSFNSLSSEGVLFAANFET